MEEMCPKCGHKWINHLPESMIKDGKEYKWTRCHSIGADGFQCECRSGMCERRF